MLFRLRHARPGRKCFVASVDRTTGTVGVEPAIITTAASKVPRCSGVFRFDVEISGVLTAAFSDDYRLSKRTRKSKATTATPRFAFTRFQAKKAIKREVDKLERHELKMRTTIRKNLATLNVNKTDSTRSNSD